MSGIMNMFVGGGGSLPFIVEYLILGGGGGGSGGGGGAGGYLEGTIAVPSGSYSLSIGAGGAFGQQTASNATVGSNSYINSFIAYGGGYGAGTANAGGPGGSGGGASNSADATPRSGGTATSGQGNAGGTASFSTGWAGAGGGGAGTSAVGTSVSGYDTGEFAGAGGGLGGAGKSSSITGTATVYGTGGQGYYSKTISNPESNYTNAGGNMPANLGVGGGGSYKAASASNGWNGGSGVIIIAYASSFPNLTSVGAGLICNGSGGNTTPDTASRAGYKVYKFTSGSGTIAF